MPAPLDDQQKERVRYHLGYLGVESGAMLSFGIPASRQTLFLIENAMNQLMAVSVPRVLTILQVLDNIEKQLAEALCYLTADQLGELALAGSKDPRARLVTDRLEREYVRWANRLADIFGVPKYPFSARTNAGGSGGAGNIPVRG